MVLVPKTKMEAGEPASAGRNPRDEFRIIGGRTIHKTAEQLAAMKKFCETNFIGGTLVEYEDEFGFEIELRRWNVRKFSIKGTQLLIQSDGKAKLDCDDINQLVIEEKESDVFRISGAHCPFAIARAGVEIDEKPGIEKVLEDARAALAEKKK